MGLDILEKLSILEKEHSRIAYIYVLIGHFMMVFQWAIFKLLNNYHFDPNQILYIRGIMVFLFNLYWIQKYKHKMYPENEGAQKTLFARFFIQMVSPLFQFYGITQLQISDATVLTLTNPIWTQLFCWLIYGEKLQSKNLLYTFLSFGGIIFICRPSFIFGSDEQANIDSSDKNHFLGCVCMLFGSMTLALSQSLFKGLQGKTSNLIAMQYFYFSNLISTPVLMIYKEINDVRIYQSLDYFSLIILITCIAYLAQLLMTRGMFIESPAKLSSLAYTRILYSFTIDIFFFKSTISYLSVIGFLLILYSSINIVKKK
ncbi:hypothetical protein ABPG74_021759 [Tetrahymena malaccensis]